MEHDEDTRAYFEELLFPFFNDALKLACRLTGDLLDAEDVVQGAYLKAYRYFASFKRGTNARAWLLWIVRNQSYDVLSARHRRLQFLWNVKQLVASRHQGNGDALIIQKADKVRHVEVPKQPAGPVAISEDTFRPLVRCKIASWLLGVWNADGMSSPCVAECEAKLRAKIDKYEKKILRRAEKRRGMKCKPKQFCTVGGVPAQTKMNGNGDIKKDF